MPLKLCPPGERANSPFWYVRGSVAGKRVEESTGETRKERAQVYLDRRTSELRDRAVAGEGAGRTFVEAVDRYLEAVKPSPRDEGWTLDVSAAIGDTKLLSEITQTTIEAAVAKLARPGSSAATINRRIIGRAAAVLHHAAKLGWIPRMPIERRKPPAGRTRFLQPAEAEGLVTAAAPHLRPLLEFLLGTGARLGEALALDWNDVELQRGHALLRDTKNGEDRGIPLNSRVVAALAGIGGRGPNGARVGRVFRRPDGEPYAEKEDGDGGQIKTGFIAACRRAGLGQKVMRWRKVQGKRKQVAIWKTDVTPHILRHTWATWFYAAHRDVRALMELGGWKSISQVQRYTHANKEHLRDKVEALAAWGQAAGRRPSEREKPNVVK